MVGMMGKLTGGTFCFFCREHTITVHRQRPNLLSPDCLQTLLWQKPELSSTDRTGLAKPGCSLHTYRWLTDCGPGRCSHWRQGVWTRLKFLVVFKIRFEFYACISAIVIALDHKPVSLEQGWARRGERRKERVIGCRRRQSFKRYTHTDLFFMNLPFFQLLWHVPPPLSAGLFLNWRGTTYSKYCITGQICMVQICCTVNRVTSWSHYIR